jgi:hypothetical protein
MNTQVIHDTGAGDFYQIESVWTEEERDQLETVWYGYNNPQSDALRQAIEANPRYAKVKHRYLRYPTELLPGVPNTLRDHSILHRKVFTGSSFLKHNLSDLAYLEGVLPERFDFIHPATPVNLPSVRKIRDMGQEEWQAVIDRLEARNTIGVIVNPKGIEDVPQHDRLVDLRGLTTMPQAIEVLKKASGFIGIDSCFAILAAQLFDHEDLIVRTNNPHVIAHRWSYYAPHEDPGFLVPYIGGEPHTKTPKPYTKGIVIESLCNCLNHGRNHGRGERLEVPKDRAEAMVKASQAIFIEEVH